MVDISYHTIPSRQGIKGSATNERVRLPDSKKVGHLKMSPHRHQDLNVLSHFSTEAILPFRPAKLFYLAELLRPIS